MARKTSSAATTSSTTPGTAMARKSRQERTREVLRYTTPAVSRGLRRSAFLVVHQRDAEPVLLRELGRRAAKAPGGRRSRTSGQERAVGDGDHLGDGRHSVERGRIENDVVVGNRREMTDGHVEPLPVERR